MKKEKSHKARLNRNVLSLGFTSFFNDWSSEMIFPLLPAFMAEVLGIPKTIIGLIEGAGQSVASVLKLFSGYVSDRIGRRKSLAVAGYTLSNAVKPFLALATSWPAVLVVRVADRVGKGIRTAPRDALIAGSSPESARGKAFGLHRAMDTSGAAVGALCAFAVMRFVITNPYRTAFLLAAIPGFIGVFVLIFGARECATLRKATALRLSWRVLPPDLKRLVAAGTIFGVGNFTFTFFLLRVRDMGVPAFMVPLVYLLHNLVYALGSYPSGVLADRWGKRRMLLLGYALYALVALGFGTAAGAPAAWGLMACLGLHMAMTDATSRALVSDHAPPEVRGTALGVYHMATGVADLPAGLLAGILWDTVSPGSVFLVGSALAVLAMGLLLTVQERRQPATPIPEMR